MWASVRSLGVWGHAPPSAFGRAAASPQTRQMRCWPSSERTTNPSSRRKRQDSLSLSLVLSPPKPLRWVSAGALLEAVIKTPISHFSALLCGGYHYPRCELRAVETLDAHRSRRRIRRFYAVPEFALCGQNIPSAGTHATPAPNRAHSGSHAETRAFRTGGGITTLGAFCAVRKPCVARCQNGVLCRFWGLVVGAPKERREPSGQRCAYARRCSEASRPRWAA